VLSLRPNLLGKFLLLFLPAFLLVVMAGLWAIAGSYISSQSDQIGARVGGQVGRISSQFTSADVLERPQQTSKLLSLLMTDPAIICVEAIRQGKPDLVISHPRMLGCKPMNPAQVVSLPVPRAAGMQLRVGFDDSELQDLRETTWALGVLVALAGVFSSGVVGAMAFRTSVTRPLASLMTAIRTMEGGKFQHAEISRRDDEIGRLCVAFNSMQDSIELQKSRTESALKELREVYDTAPAILFTMDCRGIVLSASEHCLTQLGRTEGEVVGAPLQACLSGQSVRTFEDGILAKLDTTPELSDVPLSIVSNKGRTLEVLLSVVPDRRKSDDKQVYVGVLKDVTELRQTEDDLRRLSLTDSLTGLPNRRGVSHMIEAFQNDNDNRRNMAVLFIDLDNFKTINDTYGHEAGDEILVETARRICVIVDGKGHAARMGGDEFTVVLNDVASEQAAAELGRQLIDAIKAPVELSAGTGHIGASIGIVFCADTRFNAVEALKLADQAMYLAKRNGKNRVAFYDEKTAGNISDRAFLVQNIAAGISRQWFSIHLQPIIDLASMQPWAVEALLRIRPDLGFPGSIQDLIQAAEETGQMEDLGNWIFDEAISQFLEITSDAKLAGLQISINLSPCQLTSSFIDRAISTMQEFPKLHGRVIFEITETAAMTGICEVSKLLQDLRSHGYRIAFDDFGSGYSSLSQISRLPVDVLKLDRMFAVDVEQSMADPDRQDGQAALIRCIVSLARDLNIQLVAEGLENQEVVSRFHHLGVTLAQGYVFCRPMPSRETGEWLELFSRSAPPGLGVQSISG
jgi:diguanylate cyclase (GGDEF)-like protein/PAS domain S-box-containing protein